MLYQLMANQFLSKLSPPLLAQIMGELDKAGPLGDEKVVAEGEVKADSEEGAEPSTETQDGWSEPDLARGSEFWRYGTKVAKRLNLKGTRPHLLVNGRVGWIAQALF